MESVLPTEVAKFEQLAATWWDSSGPMWPLHKLNALRAPYIEAHVKRHFGRTTSDDLSGISMLDIGCGAGLLSESMAIRGASVVGIDVVGRNIEIAREHALQQQLPVTYTHSTIESFHPESQFDVVLNMEVVEHVADFEAFLDRCAGLTRPGGLMFVATINRTFYAAVTAIFGAEYVLRWLPRGTHTWDKFVKPAEVEAILADQGFETDHRTGVAVNPFTKSMGLTDFMGGNYMLVTRRRSDHG